MHILQPKHTKLKSDEVKKLLVKYNISLSQLPKIRVDDPALPEGYNAGDVIKIERKEGDKIRTYYRVVVL
ncbi:MAG: DNA-directed RNA polymerase subunit RpoH/Rpb5 C-terminal domain-containing protein [Nanoarchaeota archaeon]